MADGETLDDLLEGRLFYEKQGEGLGEYFLEHENFYQFGPTLPNYFRLIPGGINPEKLLGKHFTYASRINSRKNPSSCFQ